MELRYYFLILVFTGLLFSASCKGKDNKKNETVTISNHSQKPNIVFIIADDMGIGDLGCYGQQYIQTPNIDKLASTGMKFTNFYAGSTVCAPSRASLMTGQHTGISYIRGNGEFPLRTKDTIISQILKKRGYTTAMFGKWGLGTETTEGSPEKKGWDYFTGHLHHVDAHFQQPDSLWTIKKGEMAQIATPPNSYANEIFTDNAVGFIENQTKENPFFLYLSFTVPHAELVVPNKYLKLYKNDQGQSIFMPEKAWPSGRHYGKQKYPKAAYAALVTSMDAYIGRVMEVIKSKGFDENTLVVFTSDNGTHIEGGRTIEDVEFFKSSSIYKGVKRDLYEGGIREPFIASWPEKIKAGQTSNHIAAFWDITPTLTELSGVKAPSAKSNGISFVNELFGKGTQKTHKYLYWEFFEGGGKQAVRKNQWKAIRLEVNKNREEPIELYNLAKDPSESKNIADQHPEIVKQMDSIMKIAHTPNPIFSFE